MTSDSDILAQIKVPDFSMFQATQAYIVDGVPVWGLMRPKVMPDDSDQVFTMTEAGQNRLDLVSAVFYQTPGLWDAIATVNNLFDPLMGAAQGSTLRIPTKNRLASMGLLNKNT